MANDKTQAYRTKGRQVVQRDPNHSPSKEEPSMRHQLQFLRVVFVAIVLCFACTATAFGQETTARISGQVTDQTGAVVNNAEVGLTNPRTHEARITKTDDNGYYSLTLIPPGRYDL